MHPSSEFKENPNVVLIRTAEDKNVQITEKLKEAFAQEDIQILRIERVGPVAGRHLKGKAIAAICWAMVGILVYVSFRFKHFNFAVAGVVALLHDVVVAAGALALTGRQIDLLSVTAFLTIAGYSIQRYNSNIRPRARKRQVITEGIFKGSHKFKRQSNARQDYSDIRSNPSCSCGHYDMGRGGFK